MNSLVLYGAGGHAKVIYDIILSNNMLLEYLLDDNPPAKVFHHINIHKPSLDLLKNKKVIIAIGDTASRKKIANKIKDICDFDILIHHSCFVSGFSELGEGTVVMPHVSINADVKIGKHCIINTGCVIEHECIIEDFVHLSPSVTLAGNITIKEGVQIGIGARVIPGITIGENAIVGAGAIVIRDVPAGATVVGNPAKIIKIKDNDERKF